MMQRIRRAWILVAFVAGCAPAGAENSASSSGSDLLAAGLVPDLTYRPQIGDRVVLYGVIDGIRLDYLPLLKDVTALDIFARSMKARDAERLLELKQQGWLRWAEPGTRVIVIDTQDRNHTGADSASQVQLVDDARKNQTFWTQTSYLARMIRTEPE
jgi:hypothetical protein